MKHKLLLPLLFLCNISFAQGIHADQQKGISPIELQNAKELYLNMMETATFKNNEALTKSFADKLPNFVTYENLIEDSDFIKFIAENIQYSKFSSVEEAVAMRKKCADSEVMLTNENADLYKFIQIATVSQVMEILKPTFNQKRAGLY